MHKGLCPKLASIDLIQPVSEPNNCHINCVSDADCSLNSKCCFNGCGLACVSVIQSFDERRLFIVFYFNIEI